jgi:hypothetical protein
LFEEITRLRAKQKRVAIIGASQPIDLAASLISQFPLRTRRDLSFTTGLPPAVHRPFAVHFLAEANPVLQQGLTSEGIVPLRVSQPAMNA